MATLHLSAPWVIFYREIAAMFQYDRQVHVDFDEAENHVKLYVDDFQKALALSLLLPKSQLFGSVTMQIAVIPANVEPGLVLADTSNQALFETAFEDNAAFSFAKTVTGIFSNNLTYVVFRNRVVQYFGDDLGDIYGQCSTLYQEIAKHIFGEQEGVFFCTDVEQSVTCAEGLGSPLGERPYSISASVIIWNVQLYDRIHDEEPRSHQTILRIILSILYEIHMLHGWAADVLRELR